jgi:hypothetical protein
MGWMIQSSIHSTERVDRLWHPNSLVFHIGVLFTEVKQLEHAVYHWPPSSAEVKNVYSCTFTPLRHLAVWTRTPLHLYHCKIPKETAAVQSIYRKYGNSTAYALLYLQYQEQPLVTEHLYNLVQQNHHNIRYGQPCKAHHMLQYHSLSAETCWSRDKWLICWPSYFHAACHNFGWSSWSYKKISYVEPKSINLSVCLSQN